MSMSNLAKHGQEALKQANNGSSNGNFPKENIWFDWGSKEEHVVRLVGDFKWIRSHWIGESSFGKDIAILNPRAFKGESKLPLSVACSNWDASTESEDPNGDCPICRLGRNADALLAKEGKNMDESDKAIIKAIRKKCAIRNTYLFKCIDRDNPWIDDAKTKKGFKIIKMPGDLLNAIIELSKKFDGTSITSPEEGIDITIKRVKGEGGGAPKFTALPVMAGMSVKQTPLTDEELQYRDLDLDKFAGKPVDKDRFEEELSDDNNVRVIYESAIDDGDAPF